MRNRLSQLITQFASEDTRVRVLSGDHGYALFDQIRSACPDQFINVGVMEQAMVGIASGLAKTGFRPIVYGLSAFVPIRVLEQIKLDVCFPCLPVLFLGDGAGLVYSTLGVSHQCGEDIACLRPLPNLKIYSPCDAEELSACFQDAYRYPGPSYLRIGKSDRPSVHNSSLRNVQPLVIHKSAKSQIALIATGSMVAPALKFGKELGLTVISVPCLKPLDGLASLISPFEKVIVLEEHYQSGGLASAVLELGLGDKVRLPIVRSISLQDKFSELCGSYQYALSAHELADSQLLERIKKNL